MYLTIHSLSKFYWICQLQCVHNDCILSTHLDWLARLSVCRVSWLSKDSSKVLAETQQQSAKCSCAVYISYVKSIWDTLHLGLKIISATLYCLVLASRCVCFFDAIALATCWQPRTRLIPPLVAIYCAPHHKIPQFHRDMVKNANDSPESASGFIWHIHAEVKLHQHACTHTHSTSWGSLHNTLHSPSIIVYRVPSKTPK